jgi:hypothetical protein
MHVQIGEEIVVKGLLGHLAAMRRCLETKQKRTRRSLHAMGSLSRKAEEQVATVVAAPEIGTALHSAGAGRLACHVTALRMDFDTSDVRPGRRMAAEDSKSITPPQKLPSERRRRGSIWP